MKEQDALVAMQRIIGLHRHTLMYLLAQADLIKPVENPRYLTIKEGELVDTNDPQGAYRMDVLGIVAATFDLLRDQVLKEAATLDQAAKSAKFWKQATKAFALERAKINEQRAKGGRIRKKNVLPVDVMAYLEEERRKNPWVDKGVLRKKAQTEFDVSSGWLSTHGVRIPDKAKR